MADKMESQRDFLPAETTGTTIMAIKYDNGILIAADSRTSSGSYVADRATDKLEKIHDTIFCLRSGSKADTQLLANYVRYYLNMHSVELDKKPHVKTAATMLSKMIYNNKDRLLAGMIVAGIDPYEGSQIYSISLGGALIPEDWTISGSGSGFIYGYCDANYRSNFSLEEAQKFCLAAIGLATARDSSSGGVARIINITKDGFERKFFKYQDLPFKKGTEGKIKSLY